MTDNNKNNDSNYSVLENNLIKKLIIDVFLIVFGVILLNFEMAFLFLPGLIITLVGLLSFIVIITLNTSVINHYNNQNPVDKDS